MTIYVDCPFSDCDDEFEFNVYPTAGRTLVVDLVKQNCECKVDIEDLEPIAADKYE